MIDEAAKLESPIHVINNWHFHLGTRLFQNQHIAKILSNKKKLKQFWINSNMHIIKTTI